MPNGSQGQGRIYSTQAAYNAARDAVIEAFENPYLAQGQAFAGGYNYNGLEPYTIGYGLDLLNAGPKAAGYFDVANATLADEGQDTIAFTDAMRAAIVSRNPNAIDEQFDGFSVTQVQAQALLDASATFYESKVGFVGLASTYDDARIAAVAQAFNGSYGTIAAGALATGNFAAFEAQLVFDASTQGATGADGITKISEPILGLQNRNENTLLAFLGNTNPAQTSSSTTLPISNSVALVQVGASFIAEHDQILDYMTNVYLKSQNPLFTAAQQQSALAVYNRMLAIYYNTTDEAEQTEIGQGFFIVDPNTGPSSISAISTQIGVDTLTLAALNPTVAGNSGDLTPGTLLRIPLQPLFLHTGAPIQISSSDTTSSLIVLGANIDTVVQAQATTTDLQGQVKIVNTSGALVGLFDPGAVTSISLTASGDLQVNLTPSLTGISRSVVFSKDGSGGTIYEGGAPIPFQTGDQIYENGFGQAWLQSNGSVATLWDDVQTSNFQPPASLQPASFASLDPDAPTSVVTGWESALGIGPCTLASWGEDFVNGQTIEVETLNTTLIATGMSAQLTIEIPAGAPIGSATVALKQTSSSGTEIDSYHISSNGSLGANYQTEIDHTDTSRDIIDNLSGIDIRTDADQNVSATTTSNIGIDIGGVFGSLLGKEIAGTNQFSQLAVGSILTGLGNTLGEISQAWLDGGNDHVTLAQAVDGGFLELPGLVGNAGLSEISSYLIAQLVEATGLRGEIGGLVNVVGGSLANTFISDLYAQIVYSGPPANAPSLWAGFTPQNLGAGLGVAVGAYFGTQLAAMVISPSTTDGQIGFELGSALGGVAATIAVASFGSEILGQGAGILAYIELGASFGFVGAFVGAVVGALVGDLFGEAPSPQAYADINVGQSATGKYFTDVFRSSKDSGPTSSVMSIAASITTELNAAIAATGGVLGNASHVPGSVVGIRQGVAEDVDRTGDHKFYGSNGVADLINYAVLTNLANLVIVGGDVYVKRALEATAAGTVNSDGTTTVDTNAIGGDIKIAQDYEKYLADESDINAIIASAPQSAFTLGWAAELAEAAALGLDARGVNDWNAGWNGFLQAQNADPTQVTFAYGGNERLITANGTIIHDTIDSTDKTIIQGSTTSGQTIALDGNTLLTPSTGTISFNGTLVAAAAGGTLTVTADTVPIAAMIYAGYTGTTAGDTIYAGSQGNDVFGGNGGDLIYGFSAIPTTTGTLTSISTTPSVADATWIWGGTGNDTIIAGISSGDYLNGGAGNDSINASLTTSAWIDGGTGNNSLIGGTGDDVITAEGGSSTSLYSDTMIGRGGTDTYIVDPYTNDTINNTPVSSSVLGGGTIELAGNVAFSQVGLAVDQSGNLDITVYAPGTNPVAAGSYTGMRGSGLVVETVVVQHWSTLADRVQYLETSGGQEIDLGNFSKIVVGTAGNNYLVGTQGNDAIFGMGGTDTIEALGGGDLINGDGFLDGGTGNDTIFGGNANDTLLGGLGSNILQGGAGNDLIMGGVLDTSSQTDIIEGGPGNDTLIGGSCTGTAAADHNLFEYAAGDGSDLVLAGLSTSAWHEVWTSAGSWQSGFAQDQSTKLGDTLSGDITLTTASFGPTIGTPIYYTQPSQVSGTLVPAGTMNGIVDVEDSISTSGSNAGLANSAIYWQPNLTQSAQTVSNANDTLQFGPSITQSEVLFLHPAGSNDLLIGINDGNINSSATPGSFAELSDEIRIENYFSTGAIGEILFEPASGSSTPVMLPTVALLGPSIDGGAQLVSVSNTATTQAYWITGAAPNNKLTSGAGDTLVGGAGNDTIVGGAGNNLLTGNAGNDSLVAGSSGIDTLDGGPGADTLVGSGQTWASYADAATGLTANLGNPTGVQQLSALTRTHMQFAGFRYGDVAQFLFGLNAFEMGVRGAGPRLTGPPTFNANTGDAKGDVYTNITGVIGSKYNDTLMAAAAGSSLDGGGGSDLLIGGAGNDDFIYNVYPTGASAYGSDTIQLGGGSDTLDIYDIGGPGVTFDNVGFASLSGTLVMTEGSAHTITIVGLTSTGQTLTINLDGDTSVMFSGMPVSGNSGFAVATSVGATVAGGTAPTMIVGSAGKDVLVGESGNDTFEGGAGADTITGASNASGTTTNTASYAGSSAGVTITLNNGAATGIGGDAQGDVLTNIQNLVGSAGNDFLSVLGTNSEIDGGTGNDTIYGSGGNDTLIGNGVDSITSGAGNMLISVANCTLTGAGSGSKLIGGAGNDTIYGGAGNDTITDTGYAVSNGTTTTLSSSINGGAGSDLITGYGNDTLDGGGGNDTITAVTGNSLLEDSSGNGILYAMGGTDTLFGGAGNNTLLGGATQNDVLISDQGSAGGLNASGIVSGADTNHLFGAGMSWVSGTGFVPVIPPALSTGNDTFELSSQSGTTTIWANYGVNEIEFDTSVKFSDLVFVRDALTAGQLDIFDPALTGTPFKIELQNVFNSNMADPSLRDITASGEVLFLTQFANSTSSTWVTTGNAVPAGTSQLTWEAPASAEDVITGSATAPNLLLGSNYNSQLTSADTIRGNTDTLKAGAGSNTIFANAANAVIYGGPNADAIYGGTGSNTVYGGIGAETITGNAMASAGATNTLIAGSGADSIIGGAAINVITGGSGADTLTGGTGASTITGGSGTDIIFGGVGATSIVGGTGAETITGGTGADTIVGGAGAESITGGSGSNLIVGGSGSDTIFGGAGPGTIRLGVANATVNGGTGADTIDLTQTSVSGQDLIYATSDLVEVGAGSDTIYGTELTMITFAAYSSGVTLNSSGVTSIGDFLTGEGTVIGSALNDVLWATNDAQASVNGGGGADSINAGTGNDTLESGFNDCATMVGGMGNDTFIIDNILPTNTGSFSISGGADNDLFEIGSGNGTIQQAARSPIGTNTLFQDVIQIEAGSIGSLSIYGPSVSGGATVSTQLAYVDSSVAFYDLWFTQSGNDLIVEEFGGSGIAQTDDLKGWFSNAAIQSSLNLQYFTAGGNPTPDMLAQALVSRSVNGSNVIGVNGLIALDHGLAQAGLTPTNIASANSLYGSDTAYHGALQLLWMLDTPPTITLNGTSETVLEGAAASFSATVSDSLTLAPNLMVSATASTGTVTSTGVNGSGGDTLTWSPTVGYTLGPVSITVTVQDGADVTSTATYTVNITPVDPAPVFTQQPAGTITMQENANGSAKGSYGPVSLCIDDLTPAGTDDAGSVLLTATSSNPSLISNGDVVLTQTAAGTYTLEVYSEPGQYGSANITLTANDGTKTMQSQPIAVTVAETAISPTITAPSSQTYNESAISQLGTIYFSATDANANASTTVSASVGANSGWLHPGAITYRGNGQDELVFTIDPDSWTNGGPGQNGSQWFGSIVLTATSAQGNAGTLSTPGTILIGSTYQHWDFTVPGTQPVPLPENSGDTQVTSLASVVPTTVVNGVTVPKNNNDPLAYVLSSVNGATSGSTFNKFFVSTAGQVFLSSGGISWTPNGTNSYTLAVQVSSAAYVHTAYVTVNVLDESAPQMSYSYGYAYTTYLGKQVSYINNIYVTAQDPYGLQSTFKLLNQNDTSSNTYALGSTSNYGTAYTVDIPVALPGVEYGNTDNLTVQATNSQGISTQIGVSFEPGFAHSWTQTLIDGNDTPTNPPADSISELDGSAYARCVSTPTYVPDANLISNPPGIGPHAWRTMTAPPLAASETASMIATIAAFSDNRVEIGSHCSSHGVLDQNERYLLAPRH